MMWKRIRLPSILPGTIRARLHLEQSRSQRGEVDRLVRELRDRRDVNGFSQSIQRAMGGQK